MSRLREGSILKSIEEFNRYRVPEVEAKLISIREDSFVIEFTGSFCHTCGFYDYFDDFRFVLKDEVGLNTEVEEVDEIVEGAVVRFKMMPDCRGSSK